eukprot:5807333-Pleurochrysis_carterae.AAC.3
MNVSTLVTTSKAEEMAFCRMKGGRHFIVDSSCPHRLSPISTMLDAACIVLGSPASCRKCSSPFMGLGCDTGFVPVEGHFDVPAYAQDPLCSPNGIPGAPSQITVGEPTPGSDNAVRTVAVPHPHDLVNAHRLAKRILNTGDISL